MERIIESPVDPRHYRADACAVWCFDDRFSPLVERLAREKRCTHLDLVKVAGGAKGLASPESGSERTYLLDQIAKSAKLHEPKEIWLMVHTDCGAYGSPKFESAEKEAEFFAEELAKAENAVQVFSRERGITAPIKKYFANFQGVVEA